MVENDIIILETIILEILVDELDIRNVLIKQYSGTNLISTVFCSLST